MDILSELNLEFTRWLQTNYGSIEPFIGYVSIIGLSEFYFFVVATIYWSLEKDLGRAMAYVMSVSIVINSMLKHLFGDPRPYWIAPDIGLSEEETYGLPSGHAQSATVFYGLIAIYFKKAWIWILVILFILLMAFSRIYLGVHDIEDVVAGILIGVLILLGYYLWNRYGAKRFANRILGQRLLAAIMVPLLLTGIYALLLILLGEPDKSVDWAERINQAERVSFENMARSVGILAGLGIGFVLEVSRVRFLIGGPVWQRLLRFVVGAIGAIALLWGLGQILPEEPIGLAIPLLLIRYFLLALWISYYAPWLFIKLRLAEARPEPEVSITL
jgi:membrane-associated phospholipid phosphatase